MSLGFGCLIGCNGVEAVPIGGPQKNTINQHVAGVFIALAAIEYIANLDFYAAIGAI